MKEQKRHIKYKGRPLCNTRQQRRKLLYASTEGQTTCHNCLRASEK